MSTGPVEKDQGPAKYRNRPVVVKAMRYEGTVESRDAIFAWLDAYRVPTHSHYDGRIFIPTPKGRMAAEPGDWIIRGVKGEFYPCKPDVFAATYEPAEVSSTAPATNSITAADRIAALERVAQAAREAWGRMVVGADMRDLGRALDELDKTGGERG